MIEGGINSALGPQPSAFITPYGEPTTDANAAIPLDRSDRLILARRLVAERCLYGVDKNPLAVEIARLSLWLATLAEDPALYVSRSRAQVRRFAGGRDEDMFERWSHTDTSSTLPLFAGDLQKQLAEALQARQKLSVWCAMCATPRKKRACCMTPIRPCSASTGLRSDHRRASMAAKPAEQTAQLLDLLGNTRPRPRPIVLWRVRRWQPRDMNTLSIGRLSFQRFFSTMPSTSPTLRWRVGNGADTKEHDGVLMLSWEIHHLWVVARSVVCSVMHTSHFVNRITKVQGKTLI